MARRSLAETRWLAFVMRECGAVLIERGAADRAALREMTDHLEGGDCVAIFPEGTRSKDGSLGEFRGGALLAAKKARVPDRARAGIRGADRRLAAVAQAAARRAHPGRLRADPIDARDGDAADRLRAAIESLVGDGRAPRP